MLLVSVAVAACGRNSGPPREPPLEELEAALTPAAIAKALRTAGGGRFHAMTTMEIDTPVAGQPALKDAVTTTTDVWLDKLGNYRLLEINDRDGGREIVVHGHDLAVAMRYSRMIRRPREEPEATRLLHEALGSPAAAWDIARRFAEVNRQDGSGPTGRTSNYEVKKADEPQSVKADFEGGSPLAKWRETVNVDNLSGQARIEAASNALTKALIEARFTLSREGTPMSGVIRVQSEITALGQVPPIEAPHADELPARQRTILEEKALLGRSGTAEAATR